MIYLLQLAAIGLIAGVAWNIREVLKRLHWVGLIQVCLVLGLMIFVFSNPWPVTFWFGLAFIWLYFRMGSAELRVWRRRDG